MKEKELTDKEIRKILEYNRRLLKEMRKEFLRNQEEYREIAILFSEETEMIEAKKKTIESIKKLISMLPK